MKANRKFLRGDDAVSPVIAVILMVAITVVLAATVYVWVSGFSASNTAAAKSMSLTKTQSGGVITYTIAAASTGLRWSDMKIQVLGGTQPYQIVTSGGDVSALSATADLTPTSTATVTAGSTISIASGHTAAVSGLELRIIDVSANSVMATMPAASADASAAGTAPTATPRRFSGSANDFTAGSTQIVFSQPLDMSTLVISDFTPSGVATLGSSTLTIMSPTVARINWASDSTVVATDTLTIATGGVNTIRASATTSAIVVTLTTSS